MAVQKLVDGRNIRFKRRTSAGPPAVFEFLCLFSSVQHEVNIQSERFPLPDCDTPSNLPSMFTSVSAVGDTFTCSGRMDASKVKVLREAARSGAAGVYQFEIAETALNGGGTLTGSFKLTAFNEGTNEGNTATVSATFASDGPITWADAA